MTDSPGSSYYDPPEEKPHHPACPCDEADAEEGAICICDELEDHEDRDYDSWKDREGMRDL